MESLITPAILALVFGVLASICIVITAFSLNRKTILWSMLFTSAFTGTQFLLLNQIAATFLIAVSLVYSALLVLENKIPIVRTRSFTVGVLLIQTAGYFIINGFSASWSILALAGTIISSIAAWLQNPIKLKWTMLLMGLVWLSYQLSTGAYGQFPGEMVFLTGIIYSITMLTKAKKRGVPLESVEELPTLIRRKLMERKTKIPAAASIVETAAGRS
jgi:hypothetical protein